MHRGFNKDKTKNYDKLTERIIGLAIEVHNELGPGLMESTSQQCLAKEITDAGLDFQMEVKLPVFYKGVNINCGYRLDLVIENEVIVELKSVEVLTDVHKA